MVLFLQVEILLLTKYIIIVAVSFDQSKIFTMIQKQNDIQVRIRLSTNAIQSLPVVAIAIVMAIVKQLLLAAKVVQVSVLLVTRIKRAAAKAATLITTAV